MSVGDVVSDVVDAVMHGRYLLEMSFGQHGFCSSARFRPDRPDARRRREILILSMIIIKNREIFMKICRFFAHLVRPQPMRNIGRTSASSLPVRPAAGQLR